jgi:hypothetical protein
MTLLCSKKRCVPMRFTASALVKNKGAQRVKVPGATG